MINKDKVRLERLRDMYKSKGYKTENLSESEIGEIAYNRSQNFIKTINYK